jgi:hypothetical protein
MADDAERKIRLRLVLEPDVVGAVVTGVIADEDLGHPSSERGGQAVEDAGEGGRGVIGDDQDANSLH